MGEWLAEAGGLWPEPAGHWPEPEATRPRALDAEAAGPRAWALLLKVEKRGLFFAVSPSEQ